MSKKRLILFDMDNTLLDADKAHIYSYNKAFEKNNLKKVKPKILKKWFGYISKKIVKELFPKLGPKEIQRIVADNHHFLITDGIKYLKPFRGVKKTLKKLSKHYHLGLVSNCTHKEILIALKQSGLKLNTFKVIVGNDDIKHPKPAPDAILKAQRLMHLKADYMIGDTIYDLIAAKKAKVKSIAVLTGNHTKERLLKQKPLYILRSINQLPKLLKC